MDKIKELKKLKELLEQGVLTELEFNSLKKNILKKESIKESAQLANNESQKNKKEEKKIEKIEESSKFRFKDWWFPIVFGGIFLISLLYGLVWRTFNEPSPKTNKNYADYSVNDWKNLADIKAKDFYECAKDLDYSTNNYYESCARYYKNDWVRYRDALDNKANLSYDKIKELKNYWQSKSDEIVEKVSTAIDKNEKNRRPNKY